MGGGVLPAGVRLDCSPDSGGRYGSEARPIEFHQVPTGVKMPRLRAAPDRALATEGTASPAETASMGIELQIDRVGATNLRPAQRAVLALWIVDMLESLEFDAARCADGQPAAIVVPAELEWTPPSP